MRYTTLLWLSLQKLPLLCLYFFKTIGVVYCHTSNIIYNFRGSPDFVEKQQDIHIEYSQRSCQ